MSGILGFRFVRTKNEKTQFYVSTDPELTVPVKVRGRRQAKQLPNVWDDCYFHRSQRNWKKFRNTQWKRK